MSVIRPAHYCDHCDHSFARSCILRDHQNAIKGIKRYSCEQCSTKFTRKHDLKMHRAEQHSDAPSTFPCRVVEVTGATQGCRRVFKRESGLARHLRAPSGRFCRLPNLGDVVTTAAPPAAAEQQLRALSPFRGHSRHLAWEADPYRDNSLDQNLTINWNRCVLNATVALNICIVKHSANQDQNGHTFLVCYGNTMQIARHCLSKGERSLAAVCATTLKSAADYLGAFDVDPEIYSQDAKVHKEFLDEHVERPRLGPVLDVHEFIDSLSGYAALAESTFRGAWTNALDNSSRSQGHNPATDELSYLKTIWGSVVGLQRISMDIIYFLKHWLTQQVTEFNRHFGNIDRISNKWWQSVNDALDIFSQTFQDMLEIVLPVGRTCQDVLDAKTLNLQELQLSLSDQSRRLQALGPTMRRYETLCQSLMSFGCEDDNGRETVEITSHQCANLAAVPIT